MMAVGMVRKVQALVFRFVSMKVLTQAAVAGGLIVANHVAGNADLVSSLPGWARAGLLLVLPMLAAQQKAENAPPPSAVAAAQQR